MVMILSKVVLLEVVPTCLSISEVARKLGLPHAGGVHNQIQKSISKHQIDITHFHSDFSRNVSDIGIKKHWSEYLISGSKKLSTSILRRAMIESGKEYKCAICDSLPEWFGKPLTLPIDHIDGVNTNNKQNNVRFLCPNCHSQTDTFGKPKSRKFNKCSCGLRSKVGHCIQCFRTENAGHIPPKEMLRELIWMIPSSKIAAEFGVSDSAVVKWCKKYGLSKPGRGYWAKNK